MEQTKTLLQQAAALRKAKAPEQAKAIYESLLGEQAYWTQWDWWGYAQCCADLKQYEAALEICRRAYASHSGFAMLRQLYARCIYYTQLSGKKEPGSEQLYKKAVEAMVQLSPPGEPYSLTAKAIFKYIKHLSQKPSIPWETIGQWLEKMNVERLSKEVYTIPGQNGKRDMELASEQEEWFSWKIKYLLHTAQWQPCIDMINLALSTINKWHYSNDIWFLRKKAAALHALGSTREALSLMEQLLLKKKEWFFEADLGHMKQDPAEKVVHFAKAMAMPGDDEKKVGMLQALSQCLLQLQKQEEAGKVALYEVALRNHAGWKIPAESEKVLEQAGLTPGKIEPPAHYRAAVLAVCRTYLPSKARGTIIKILPDGKSGFIQPIGKGEKLYYRNKNSLCKPWLLKEGVAVLYNAQKSYDKKKQKESWEAVEIELAEKSHN
jgi:hypothetical protein